MTSLLNQTLQAVEVVVDIESANDKIAGRVRQLVHHSEAGVAPTPFAALIAKSYTALTPKEKVGQVGTAAHGVQVQKSAALLQQVRKKETEKGHLVFLCCYKIIWCCYENGAIIYVPLTPRCTNEYICYTTQL